MLCWKSAWVEGLRQTGPVQVAYRIWDRCRSLTPGSWPLASYRWSQSWVVIGSSATSRSRCPLPPVRSFQLPYPPGGPRWPEAVKESPGSGGPLVPPDGSGPPGRPGLPGLSRRLAWFLGSGRAHPWPMACPCSSVTVTHHVVLGFWAAEQLARSRARAGSIGPGAAQGVGPSGQLGKRGHGGGPVDPEAIAPLGPLAGPLPALFLPQAAKPYPTYRAVVAEHSIL